MAAWAVCAPRAPEVVSALASSLGLWWDTQKPSWPTGRRQEAFGDKGHGRGDSAGPSWPLGGMGHCSRDMVLWTNRDSAVPAVPSLERCGPLDRTQLLKEPLL